jgi:Nuclease-related domain
VSEALTVTRWRKYGKDRLYVSTVDGTRAGWHDLLSGETHVEATADRDAVLAAIGNWHDSASAGTGGPVTAAVSVPQPAAVTADPEYGDTVAAVQVPQSAPFAVEAASPDPEPTTPPIPPAMDDEPAGAVAEWEDLAARRAGTEAREQAVALRQAAPVRTFLARVLMVHTDERAWRIGADGEEKVAAQLDKLVKRDSRWRIVHAIPVGDRGSDIDHLVIGPGGVYSLNAKHHPGAKVWVAGSTFMVNGQRQPYLRNSRHEAQRAGKLLTAAAGQPVAVTGVVVPVGADDFVIKQPPVDVVVINRMRLVKWLQARPETLELAAIEAVFEAARRSTTWRPR